MDVALLTQRPLSCWTVFNQRRHLKFKPFLGFFPHGRITQFSQVIGFFIHCSAYSCMSCMIFLGGVPLFTVPMGSVLCLILVAPTHV
jgi:hypothetical protein